ncbi:MAG: BamA/TamA family outer membrane protein, partial [Pseudomonadota bacterium]
RDPITGDPLGGQTYWNATAEIQFPLPFISRSIGLRGALFADAGQLFNPGTGTLAAIAASNPGLTAAQLAQADDDALRASVGGSVIWDSPFGPLRVDYAVPISEQPFDDIEELNFGISSAF